MSVSVLVLGGLGFIGRSFVKYLVDFNLATHIRIVDKRRVETAYLSPAFAAIMKDSRVEVLQANLASPMGVEKAYAPTEQCPHAFNLVVCLAAETKYGQPEGVYQSWIRDLRIACAQQAAARGINRYVEVSTAQVYGGGSSRGAKESEVPKPWTMPAKYHLEAEQALRAIPGLNYCVLRLPLVYGPGDHNGLMPRLVCAAVYQHTHTKMEFLWGEDLRVHTVHVQDVAAALWHLLCSEGVGDVYNLTDDGDTSQGTLNSIIEEIFHIDTGFYSTITSTIAQTQINDLVESANEDLTTGWTELFRAAKLVDSPLSPIIDKELLSHHHIALDASKIKATGFQCSCPRLTATLARDSLRYWTELNALPPIA